MERTTKFDHGIFFAEEDEDEVIWFRQLLCEGAKQLGLREQTFCMEGKLNDMPFEDSILSQIDKITKLCTTIILYLSENFYNEHKAKGSAELAAIDRRYGDSGRGNLLLLSPISNAKRSKQLLDNHLGFLKTLRVRNISKVVKYYNPASAGDDKMLEDIATEIITKNVDYFRNFMESLYARANGRTTEQEHVIQRGMSGGSTTPSPASSPGQWEPQAGSKTLVSLGEKYLEQRVQQPGLHLEKKPLNLTQHELPTTRTGAQELPSMQPCEQAGQSDHHLVLSPEEQSNLLLRQPDMSPGKHPHLTPRQPDFPPEEQHNLLLGQPALQAGQKSGGSARQQPTFAQEPTASSLTQDHTCFSTPRNIPPANSKTIPNEQDENQSQPMKEPCKQIVHLLSGPSMQHPSYTGDLLHQINSSNSIRGPHLPRYTIQSPSISSQHLLSTQEPLISSEQNPGENSIAIASREPSILQEGEFVDPWVAGNISEFSIDDHVNSNLSMAAEEGGDEGGEEEEMQARGPSTELLTAAQETFRQHREEPAQLLLSQDFSSLNIQSQ